MKVWTLIPFLSQFISAMRPTFYRPPMDVLLADSILVTPKLSRVLRDDDSIQLQVYLVPSTSQNTGHSRSKPRGKKTAQPRAKNMTLSIILYGSMDIFESVGDFLSRCSEFLQPPLRCDRNVPYCNPQSLAGKDGNPTMTYQLQGVGPNSTIESVAQDADPSAALENEDNSPETEAPAAIKSSLYRYVLTR